jgi:replicative DNA helicase
MRKIDRDAEEAVLGAILLSDKTFRAVTEEGLRAEHFGSGQLRTVFAASQSLVERGEPVDPVTLNAELTRQRKIEYVGGEAAVYGLSGAVPNVGNVRSYARRVVEMAYWRDIGEAAQTLGQAADVEDRSLVASAERLLAPKEKRNEGVSLSSEVFDYMAQTSSPGIAWPFRQLNELAGGMHPAETTMISGFTGLGKSIITDTILQHAANKGHSVRLYITEGSRTQRALRAIARETGIPYSRLRRRSVSDEERKKVVAILSRGLPFEIVQAAGWSAVEIARDMRWNPVDLTATDLIHEIAYRDERELAANWSTLKAAGVQNGTHLIAVAHLNEARATSEKPPPPVLRDIRGSGGLKNGSDNVLFIHRDHTVEDGRGVPELTGSLWFAKSRSAELGGLRVHLDPARMRFVPATIEV